jgi:hypothetical protein
MFHYICCLFGLVPIICCIDYVFFKVFPGWGSNPRSFCYFSFISFASPLSYIKTLRQGLYLQRIYRQRQSWERENRPITLGKLACLIISGKKLEIIWSHILKSSLSWKITNGSNKLECLSLVSLSSLL